MGIACVGVRPLSSPADTAAGQGPAGAGKRTDDGRRGAGQRPDADSHPKRTSLSHARAEATRRPGAAGTAPAPYPIMSCTTFLNQLWAKATSRRCCSSVASMGVRPPESGMPLIMLAASSSWYTAATEIPQSSATML